jgi:hypothetical protein
VLSAEHFFRLAGVDDRGELVEGARKIAGDRLTRLRPFDEDGEVVGARFQRLTEIAVLFEPAPALQELLRGLLVLPEIRVADAFFYFREFVRGSCGVKDSSAGPPRGARDPRTCEAGRRCWWP